jgi:hypothetical protein
MTQTQLIDLTHAPDLPTPDTDISEAEACARLARHGSYSLTRRVHGDERGNAKVRFTACIFGAGTYVRGYAEAKTISGAVAAAEADANCFCR